MSDRAVYYLAIPANSTVILPPQKPKAITEMSHPNDGRAKSQAQSASANPQVPAYIPAKRFYVPLPALTIEYADIKDAIKPTASLRRWNTVLKVSLARHQLYRYLVEDVPAPNQDQTSVEYLNWRNDRFDIIELILASVHGIVLAMNDNGWYPSSDDPRHIYFKVFEAYGFNGPEDI